MARGDAGVTLVDGGQFCVVRGARLLCMIAKLHAFRAALSSHARRGRRAGVSALRVRTCNVNEAVQSDPLCYIHR